MCSVTRERNILGQSTRGCVPAVVDEGSEGEEHLVASGDIPEGSDETQVNEIALSEISESKAKRRTAEEKKRCYSWV